MNASRFAWRVRLRTAALMAAFLLSVSLTRSQVAAPATTKDEKPPVSSKKPADEDPPLPPKKPADEDPPFPPKKPMPARQIRVQVTAASAEVRAGEKVIATVSRGQVLPFTREKDGFYLVIVDDKKGWINGEEVRKVEVAVEEKDGPTIQVPPGPALAVIDKATARKVKQATTYLRVRLENGNTVEGSGFFAVQPGLVLTNAHVLGMLRPGSPMPAEVRVVVHSGEPEEFTLAAQVLAVDRENDLSVLRIKARAGRLPAPLPVDTSRSLDLTQKVYIFGFPFGKSLGKDITASESSVSAIRKDAGFVTEVQVNGGMHRGNSGGPVVDTRGVVVGVAVAGIPGTQINKAIPGERVQELLRGRVAQTQFGEAFLDKDQTKVPVRLSCLDPLERIRTVKVDVWAGKPGPTRPLSPTEPKPLPGDGARRSLVVIYKDGAAQVDAAIPSLTPGQVLWIQPVLADTGEATHWARAVAYKPSDLPALERKPALLQQNFERQANRTIKLTGAYKIQISRGPKGTLLRESTEVEALETAQKDPRGGRLDLFLGASKFTTIEMNDVARPSAPRAQAFLRGRDMTYLVDHQGAMLQRTVPVLNPPYPPALREDFADLVHQIANPYEMTCLPLPNRSVAAQETWQARVPLILNYEEKREQKKTVVDMVLTCTYEGSRSHGGQKVAVISLSGTIKARKPGQQSTGIVTGKVHFALDDGYLSLANIKVESEGEYDEITVAHSLDVLLTRVRGNTAGIVVRPLAPLPGALPATSPEFELAIPHIQKRDYDQAIPLLEKAIAANPNLVPALSELGFAYNEKRLFDKAIPVFKKLIAIQPNHALAHNNLGAAYGGKGLYDEAIPCYKKAIAIDGTLAVGHGNLGFAYNAKRLYDQAIPCYETVIKLEPRNASAYNNLGNAYTAKRLHDKAIPCFKKVIELDKKNIAAHHALGFNYIAKGLYDDAIPCFKKVVLELDPKHPHALNNLGFAYNAQGLYDQGIPWLKKTIELHPKQLIPYGHLGTGLAEVGDLKQACEILKKALALTPETAPEFKSKKQKLEEMETLLRLEPRMADIVKGELKPKTFLEGLQFAKVCRLKQHYRAAIRLYEQACASDPDAAKKLSPIHLVTQARVAVLASAGNGNDPPPDADRPAYRAKALAWLQKFVKTQQEALEKNFDANRYGCQIHLRVLLQHKGFASVRPPALSNLPAGERKEWETFWNEVDTFLDKADALPPDPSAGGNP